MRLKAIGSTPVRSKWFICSSVRSAVAMSSMSLRAVTRAVIEVRHGSLAGGNGLGTRRHYAFALLLDLGDARGDKHGEPLDDLAAGPLRIPDERLDIVLTVEALEERGDVLGDDRAMLSGVANERAAELRVADGDRAASHLDLRAVAQLGGDAPHALLVGDDLVRDVGHPQLVD